MCFAQLFMASGRSSSRWPPSPASCCNRSRGCDMDFLNQALGVLGAVAPTIATAFGGPLAGQAVRWVEGALGLPQLGDKEAAAAAIANATPDQILALKKADQDFAVHLKALDIDLERIAAGDRDSARRMQG